MYLDSMMMIYYTQFHLRRVNKTRVKITWMLLVSKRYRNIII